VPGYSSINITHDLGSNTVMIRGQIPLSSPVSHEQLSVENPTLYAATVFREVLEEKGITVTGKTKSARDLAKAIPYLKLKVLMNYVSPPMSQIVAVMNKESDNLYAEQLFRTMGKELGGQGDWKNGIDVMRKFLASIAVDTAHITIYDGSGLSRMDLISANQMVTLLRSMYERKGLFDAFYPSLSIMGVDGTLARRLKDTRAQGNVHAKSGFVTEVRSISGYVTTKDGELLAFAILGNGLTTPVALANNLHDLVMLRLANFSRK
jgi:D-alanyl-D-alanine carboxypeptidase/D-alanyl-D-alanine-endopeptidase (penicillin-binding protein 4)